MRLVHANEMAKNVEMELWSTKQLSIRVNNKSMLKCVAEYDTLGKRSVMRYFNWSQACTLSLCQPDYGWWLIDDFFLLQLFIGFWSWCGQRNSEAQISASASQGKSFLIFLMFCGKSNETVNSYRIFGVWYTTYRLLETVTIPGARSSHQRKVRLLWPVWSFSGTVQYPNSSITRIMSFYIFHKTSRHLSSWNKAAGQLCSSWEY
jgi:hypothetical protein